MYRIALIIVLFIFPLTIYSQDVDNKLDSVFQELFQTPESDIEKKIKLHIGVCKFSFRNNPELSIEHGSIALSMAKSIGDRASQSRALRRISAAYARLGNKEIALSYLLEALSISRELDNQKVLASILNEIAGIYLSNNELDKAESYSIESFKIRKRINDQRGLIFSNVILAAIYTKNKKYTLALEYINHSIKFADSLNDESLVYMMIGNKAEIYSAMGNIDVASKLYNQSKLGLEKLGNLFETLVVLRDFSSALLQAKKYNLCIEKANEGLSLTDKMLFKMEFRLILSKAYEALGDIPNSHLNQSIYIHLSDSMRKVEKEADIARLEIIYKMKQKDDEIALKDKAILEMEQKQFANRLTWTLITLTVLLLFSVAYIIYLRLKGRIKLMNLEIADKDKAIVEVALSVMNKDGIIDSVSDDKYRSGSVIDKEMLEEHIIVSHNQFISNLSKLYPALSKKEKRICSLIKLQLSSKEIADILNLSSKSVDTYRYNIRKKMELSSKDSMSKHMDEI